MSSQKESIKQYLLTGQTLTPLDALHKFGCFRLGARIWDLRHEGYQIENVGSDDGNYAVYRIKLEPEAAKQPEPVQLPPAFKASPKAEQPKLFQAA